MPFFWTFHTFYLCTMWQYAISVMSKQSITKAFDRSSGSWTMSWSSTCTVQLCLHVNCSPVFSLTLERMDGPLIFLGSAIAYWNRLVPVKAFGILQGKCIKLQRHLNFDRIWKWRSFSNLSIWNTSFQSCLPNLVHILHRRTRWNGVHYECNERNTNIVVDRDW